MKNPIGEFSELEGCAALLPEKQFSWIGVVAAQTPQANETQQAIISRIDRTHIYRLHEDLNFTYVTFENRDWARANLDSNQVVLPLSIVSKFTYKPTIWLDEVKNVYESHRYNRLQGLPDGIETPIWMFFSGYKQGKHDFNLEALILRFHLVYLIGIDGTVAVFKNVGGRVSSAPVRLDLETV